jgi:hypothetical protein
VRFEKKMQYFAEERARMRAERHRAGPDGLASGQSGYAGARHSGALQALLGVFGSRLALLAVVLLAFGWSVTGPLAVARHAQESPFRVDYLAYDTGATIIREGDAGRLYDTRLQREVQERRTGNREVGYTAYLNPPAVAAAFVPLAQFSARQSYVIVVSLLAGILLGATALHSRLLDGAGTRTKWIAAICLLGSTTSASALMSGQLTPLLLCIAFGAMLLYRAGRVELSGAALGLLLIKPHFAVAVLLVLVLARQRKMMAYMSAMVLAGTLASVLVVGSEGVEGYVAMMRRSYVHPAGLFIDVRTEQNLRGLAASALQVYGGPILAWSSLAITAAVLVAVGAAIVRCTYAGFERVQYVAGLGAVFVCSAAPHIQYYDLALLAIPVTFILLRAAQAAPHARSRFHGVIVLTILWIEFAGMLTGARISFSVIPLLAFTSMFVAWPRFEAWLVRPARSDASASDLVLPARAA